ncbi:hypothetical protein BDM02DRAFT_317644 [Thelephora ganbajun]|uniref:Uncharacterized protein n=1 Tax=Thelephora ganbajun TaxID=370292 RepID=A0ACB6Z8N4_THEGA|nr:hypothetical protein BDM02DRAFT_317644 [Thelephora ganbajun]
MALHYQQCRNRPLCVTFEIHGIDSLQPFTDHQSWGIKSGISNFDHPLWERFESVQNSSRNRVRLSTFRRFSAQFPTFREKKSSVLNFLYRRSVLTSDQTAGRGISDPPHTRGNLSRLSRRRCCETTGNPQFSRPVVRVSPRRPHAGFHLDSPSWIICISSWPWLVHVHEPPLGH